MLVLSRRKNEAIVVTVPPSSVPTVVKVLIVDHRGDKVRVGVDAPRNVPVHRDEVQKAIERERTATDDNGRNYGAA